MWSSRRVGVVKQEVVGQIGEWKVWSSNQGVVTTSVVKKLNIVE